MRRIGTVLVQPSPGELGLRRSEFATSKAIDISERGAPTTDAGYHVLEGELINLHSKFQSIKGEGLPEGTQSPNDLTVKIPKERVRSLSFGTEISLMHRRKAQVVESPRSTVSNEGVQVMLAIEDTRMRNIFDRLAQQNPRRIGENPDTQVSSSAPAGGGWWSWL